MRHIYPFLTFVVSTIIAIYSYFAIQFYPLVLELNMDVSSYTDNVISTRSGEIGFNQVENSKTRAKISFPHKKNSTVETYRVLLFGNIKTLDVKPLTSAGEFVITQISIRNFLVKHVWNGESLRDNWKALSGINLKPNNPNTLNGVTNGEGRLLLEQMPFVNTIPPKFRLALSFLCFLFVYTSLNARKVINMLKTFFSVNGIKSISVFTDRMFENRAQISLCIGFLVASLFFINSERSPLWMTLDLSSDNNSLGQIFYDTGRSFNEFDSHQFNIIKGRRTYVVDIPANTKSLRLDPTNIESDFVIHRINVASLFGSLDWQKNNLLSVWKETNQIILKKTNDGILGKSLGEDPYITLDPLQNINLVPMRFRLVFAVLAFLITYAFARFILLAIKNNNILKFSCVANLLISFLIIAYPPESSIYLKIFSAIFFVFILPGMWLSNFLHIGYQSKLVKIILYLAIGTAAWFVSIYLTSISGASISPNMIKVVVVLYSVSWLIYLILRREKKTFDTLKKIELNHSHLFYLTAFNLLLFLVIFPTKGLLVPPLHDPSQNSYFSNELLKGSFSFVSFPKYASDYPPGMAYIVSILSGVTGINTAKMVLVMTNFFNLAIPFAFAAFLRVLTKNSLLDKIGLYSVAFLSAYPLGLYYYAGKNSQIVAYFFFFVSITLFYLAVQHPGKVVIKIFSALLFYASFLVHFNNIFITFFIALLIYLFVLLSRKGSQSIRSIVKDITSWIILGFALLLLLIVQLKIMNSSPYGGTFTSGLNSVSGFNFNIMSFSDFYNFISLRDFGYFIKLGTLSYVYIVCLTIYRYIKYKRSEMVEILIALLPAIFYFIFFLNIKIISDLVFLNVFIIFVLQNSYLFYLIFSQKKLKLLSIGLIISLLVFGAIKYRGLYKNYILARRYSVVREGDLKAFDWINRNIPQDEYFLPGNLTRLNLGDHDLQPFELDSILYLKLFTEREEIFGFADGNIFSHEIPLRKKYIELAKDVSNKKILLEFNKRGIYYVFDGSYKPWGPGLINFREFANNPKIFRVIYDEDGVVIYKFDVAQIN